MNELEEILELLGEEQLEELKGELFLLLANCVASQHFQVRVLVVYLEKTSIFAHICSSCFQNLSTHTSLPWPLSSKLRNTRHETHFLTVSLLHILPRWWSAPFSCGTTKRCARKAA